MADAEGKKRRVVRRVVKKGAAAEGPAQERRPAPLGDREKLQPRPPPPEAPEELKKELYLFEKQEDTTGKRQPLNFYDKQLYDYTREILGKNVWYYRDRLSVARGPCNLPVIRDCWVHGIVDEDTLVWGQGLGDWLPIKNVRTLVPLIRTPEVQVATWIKKVFALRPALNRIRRERGGVRPATKTDQVDRMY